jgi:hypothetical protein
MDDKKNGATDKEVLAPKPPTSSTPRSPPAKKGTHVASGSNQPPADQQTDDKKKGATDKEVPADPSDPDKKLHISTNLEAKKELALITFLQANLDVFVWQI